MTVLSQLWLEAMPYRTHPPRLGTCRAIVLAQEKTRVSLSGGVVSGMHFPTDFEAGVA